LERECQVEAVALTTREHPGLLLLVWALEPELRNVRAGRDLCLAHLNEVVTLRDDLPESLVRVDAATALVDVGDLHGLADLQVATVQGLQPDDGLEQGGLSDTVGTDDSDDAVAWQSEGEPVDKDAVVEALLEVLRLNDLGSESRPHRDHDLFEIELSGLLRFGRHLLV